MPRFTRCLASRRQIALVRVFACENTGARSRLLPPRKSVPSRRQASRRRERWTAQFDARDYEVHSCSFRSPNTRASIDRVQCVQAPLSRSILRLTRLRFLTHVDEQNYAGFMNIATIGYDLLNLRSNVSENAAAENVNCTKCRIKMYVSFTALINRFCCCHIEGNPNVTVAALIWVTTAYAIFAQTLDVFVKSA